MRRAGVTLVELLIALGVMGILGGVNAAILKAGFESWEHNYTRLAVQGVANELMEALLEGGFDEDGLRDAVELKDARLTGISFVTLWTDRSHVPNRLTNKAQTFTLEKQFKAGAVVPVGQVRQAGSDDWVSVPVTFAYGAGNDPSRPDDVVTFSDPIPDGASIKIIYTPDAEVHPDVQMRFSWNPDDGQLYRSYSGVTRPVLRQMQGVRVERAAFLYYDNLNRLLPLGQAYSLAEVRRITGTKIYLLLTKGSQWKELTSFTNIRNVQTIGATITRGSTLPLPPPKAIKAFSLGDFYGMQREGIIELVVHVDQRPRLKMHLTFQTVEASDRLLLRQFQIEAPPGTLRTSGILNQTLSQNEFVNLLSLDRTGLYDYDYDMDIKDQLVLKGHQYMVEVTRCDFSVVSLFIRP